MRKILLATSSVLLLGNAALAGPPTFPPLDTNVINTVDTNVVTTLSADQLAGVEFVGEATGVFINFIVPIRVHAVSASVAPLSAGDTCPLLVGVKSNESADSFKPLGLSVMSNGQAATVSQTYEVPIDGVWEMEFDTTRISSCAVTLSVSYSILPASSADLIPGAQSFEGERQPRIEVR